MRPLLLDYPDLDFWFHVRVKPDGHAEYAQRLERLMQIHLPLLDLEPLSLQLRRDVGRGDGTEQLSFLANARGEGERDLLELFGESLGRVATLVLRRFQPVLFLGDAFEVSGSRLEGDTARQQKIARVSVRDLHDVARLTQVLDGLTKNDFHSSGSGEWSVGSCERLRWLTSLGGASRPRCRPGQVQVPRSREIRSRARRRRQAPVKKAWRTQLSL